MVTLNERTINIKLKRRDVCDLLIACTWACRNADVGVEKWYRLHDLLMTQLDEFDLKVATGRDKS